MMDLRRQRRRALDKQRSGMIGGITLGLLAAGMLVYYAARRSEGTRRLPFVGKRRTVHLEGSINIDRGAEDIYNYWRNFVQLPKVMTFLDRIEDRGGGLTHWVAKGPLGTSIEWDSEVVDDIPNERISWQSLEGSDINTWGNVQFRDNPRGRGTNVTVGLNFEPPGRMAGAAIGHFLTGLEQAMLNQNLRNLKAYMETGEVPTNRWQGNRRQEHRASL